MREPVSSYTHLKPIFGCQDFSPCKASVYDPISRVNNTGRLRPIRACLLLVLSLLARLHGMGYGLWSQSNPQPASIVWQDYCKPKHPRRILTLKSVSLFAMFTAWLVTCPFESLPSSVRANSKWPVGFFKRFKCEWWKGFFCDFVPAATSKSRKYMLRTNVDTRKRMLIITASNGVFLAWKQADFSKRHLHMIYNYYPSDPDIGQSGK